MKRIRNVNATATSLRLLPTNFVVSQVTLEIQNLITRHLSLMMEVIN